MEEPGYQGARVIFEQQRFKVIACPVYQGATSYMRFLSKTNAKLCFITPSNQFPTGMIFAMQARLQLLDCARANDAYILEYSKHVYTLILQVFIEFLEFIDVASESCFLACCVVWLYLLQFV